MKRPIKAILASGVWDWYPCGVACCAGDLVTLRSTNGGVTWSVLERRLDKAPVLDGTPFLASKGSGTQRIGSEQAVTDALGVRRSGSYGTALNSMLNPLRGDAGVEETLRQLQAEMHGVSAMASEAPMLVISHSSLHHMGFAQSDLEDACLRELDRCLDRVDRLANKCLRRAGAGLGSAIRKCRLLIHPKPIALCKAGVLAAYMKRVAACHARYDPQRARCRAKYERCKEGQSRIVSTNQEMHSL